MLYATIEDDVLYLKQYTGDVYQAILEYEETMGLIELAVTDEYIIYKTDFSCPYEHLILVGVNGSLSLKAQYQLMNDFNEIELEVLRDE